MVKHYVTCPRCGGNVLINKSGRKPLNVGVKNICDALRGCKDVTSAAKQLGCSRAYIYKMLKSEGLTPRQVVEVKP